MRGGGRVREKGRKWLEKGKEEAPNESPLLKYPSYGPGYQLNYLVVTSAMNESTSGKESGS